MSKLLEFVKYVKKEYINKFGNISYDGKGDDACIKRWAAELGDQSILNVLDNITIRQKGDYAIFKYTKFEALFSRLDGISYSNFWDMYDGIYRECRGSVIDLRNECFVSRPFDKFFGLNEKEEVSEKNVISKIQGASCVEYTDKLDGCIITVRYYNQDYIITSSSMFDSIQVKQAKAYMHKNYKELVSDYSNYTFMFELIDPIENHTVVYTPDMYGLHLIGMRKVDTGELLPYSTLIELAYRYRVLSTKFYNMSFAEILKSRDDYKAEEKEGYVAFIDGLLVKIKCTDYIMLNRFLSSKCNMNHIIEAIYLDKLDDMLQTADDSTKAVIEGAIQKIREYEALMGKEVDSYMEKAPKDRVEFFKWVKTVPDYISRYVRARYLGLSLSFLVIRDDGKQVKYIRYFEIENIIKKLKRED